MASAGIRLGRIVLMVRGSEGLAKAADFYHGALGLAVHRITDDWAELRCSTCGSTRNGKGGGGDQQQETTSSTNGTYISINLQAVQSEAQLSQSYSPILSFEVDDMDTTVTKCAQMGGNLDGPIQYPAHGKVAALRAPGGQMIGLYEPAR